MPHRAPECPTELPTCPNPARPGTALSLSLSHAAPSCPEPHCTHPCRARGWVRDAPRAGQVSQTPAPKPQEQQLALGWGHCPEEAELHGTKDPPVLAHVLAACGVLPSLQCYPCALPVQTSGLAGLVTSSLKMGTAPAAMTF